MMGTSLYDWRATLKDTSAWRFCHNTDGREKFTYHRREDAEREAARLTKLNGTPYEAYACKRHRGWHYGARKR
jgi:nitrate/TMAO reductase-like tetraheme cytochrome c subunit